MAQHTLDDIAALLMQLEPSDTAELGAVRDRLMSLGGNSAAPPPRPVRALLAEAIVALDDLVAGRSPDAAAALDEIGQVIGRAMAAADGETAPTAPAAPKAKPAVAQAVATPPGAAATLAADTDIPLTREFITESRDCLSGSESALLALESNPEDGEAINTVFRAFHTIKGTSAFLGLKDVSEFAHRAESLLSRVRDRALAYSRECADLALRSADMLRELLDTVEQALDGGSLTRPDGYEALADELHAIEISGTMAVRVESAAPPALALVASGAPTEPAAPAAAAKASPRKSEQAEQSVRVRTDRLDRLIDMVGELVIAQAMISQDDNVLSQGRHDLQKKVTHAGKIVRELQDLSMSMRMVPLRSTFQKLARLVRDLAYKNGKQVEFVTDGEDTEIDRNMVDIIGDPLVHMVRNALDHGLEPPDARAAAGKSRTGTVRLAAYHAGGNVIVELQDDGRGLNRDKIVQKAIEKGLIESDKGMDDRAIYNLIFAPGFSTADRITDVSGRGVGMDVVKRNVEALHGRVEITSEFGRGTTFSVRLPLTLAITDGMLVQVGAERYIVPTINILMSFRPARDSLFTIAGQGEVVMLRGEVMPIVRIHRIFGVPRASEDPVSALLMIVADGERRCALLVDELLGQHQVVAKPLGDGIGQVPGLAGGAILGDGKVGLILDVTQLCSLARQGARHTPPAPAEQRSVA